MALNFIFELRKPSSTSICLIVIISMNYEEDVIRLILSGKIKNIDDFYNYIYRSPKCNITKVRYRTKYSRFKKKDEFVIEIIDSITSNVIWDNSVFLSRKKKKNLLK